MVIPKRTLEDKKKLCSQQRKCKVTNENTQTLSVPKAEIMDDKFGINWINLIQMI